MCLQTLLCTQYFTASFVLLLVYGLWAGWLTQDDMTVSVWPQLSIVAMQSMLLFMFWMTAVNMEEQLVPLNKVIEREPDAAKASCPGGTTVSVQGLTSSLCYTILPPPQDLGQPCKSSGRKHVTCRSMFTRLVACTFFCRI